MRELTDLLAASPNVEGLEDFVASIDWSDASRATPVVRGLLGELEALVHAVEEGELAAGEVAEHIRATLLAAAM
jgi:hypothetical protein